MCEVPSNAVLAEQFLEFFDGFSIGSNDLTQLTLGLDRDSGLVAEGFDERDPAVNICWLRAITACRAQGKYIGICGQGPSDHVDFALWLMEQGIESISLNPDTVVETWRRWRERHNRRSGEARMGDWVWWFVLAFVLLVAELLTVTFYLLMIRARPCRRRSGKPGRRFASRLQLLVAAVLGFSGALLLRRLRFGKLQNDQAEPLQNMDVGQSLKVDGWSGTRTARANYRGAQWDIEACAGRGTATG